MRNGKGSPRVPTPHLIKVDCELSARGRLKGFGGRPATSQRRPPAALSKPGFPAAWVTGTAEGTHSEKVLPLRGGLLSHLGLLL